MSTNTPKTPVRFIVGLLLGAALALIAIAVWMIAQDEGAPVYVALAGSGLALAAAVIATQTKKK